MPLLPADALSPAGTCSNCHRILVNRRWADANTVPAGLAIHAGKGLCRGCTPSTRPDGPATLNAMRGAPMPFEYTLSAYKGWAAERAARIARRQWAAL